MRREQRETVFIIGVVIIVVTISLIAVLYFIWQLISPPLVAFVEQVQYGISVNQANYNFPFPGYNDSYPVSDSKVFKANNYAVLKAKRDRIMAFLQNPDYNFKYSNWQNTQSSPLLTMIGEADDLLTPEQSEIVKDATINYQNDLDLYISKIGLRAELIYGREEDLAERGLWVLPGSAPLGEGVTILLCQRRFLSPADPRSCWNLDDLEIGEGMLLEKNKQVVGNYQVTATYTTSTTDILPYSTEGNPMIRIITPHPIGDNQRRYIVEAKVISE